MQDTNPYQPPRSESYSTAAQRFLPDVESGQKLVIRGFLVNLLVMLPLQQLHPLLLFPLLLVGVGMALVGVLRLSRGLAWSSAARVALVVLLFVPLVGLVTLLLLNARANRELRRAGYKVGFLGASRKLRPLEPAQRSGDPSSNGYA